MPSPPFTPGVDTSAGPFLEASSSDLSSISLFHLGQANPSCVNSYASVEASEDRPHLSFVAGCSTIYVLLPQTRGDGTEPACQYDWRPVQFGQKNQQILGICATLFSTAPDDIWLLVASMQTHQCERKPTLTVIQFDRTTLTSERDYSGNVMKSETIDWQPVALKVYQDELQAHNVFLISGSDGSIHPWVLTRNNYYTSFHDISVPASIGQIGFLRHLTAVRSVVLTMDYVIKRNLDLWATGTQDGWLQLWVVTHDQSDGKQGARLLNGPLSAVHFFTLAQKREKGSLGDELTAILRRAEGFSGTESSRGFLYAYNLMVVEALGRVLIFWDVERFGLQKCEALPVGTLDHEGVISAQECMSPLTQTPTSPRADRLDASDKGVSRDFPTPTQQHLRHSSSTQTLHASDPSPSPVWNLDSSLKANQRGDIHNDGGLLGTGALCAHASDSTGDGITELMVGTYAKGMLVYRVAQREVWSEEEETEVDACADVPYRFAVALVRWFPYAVHSIHTLEPIYEATRELQILTTFHLHVVGPDIDEARHRVRQRLALVQEITELEQDCRAKGIMPEQLYAGSRGESEENTGGDDGDSGEEAANGDQPPEWIVERFVLGR